MDPDAVEVLKGLVSLVGAILVLLALYLVWSWRMRRHIAKHCRTEEELLSRASDGGEEAFEEYFGFEMPEELERHFRRDELIGRYPEEVVKIDESKDEEEDKVWVECLLLLYPLTVHLPSELEADDRSRQILKIGETDLQSTLYVKVAGDEGFPVYSFYPADGIDLEYGYKVFESLEEFDRVVGEYRKGLVEVEGGDAGVYPTFREP